MSSFAATHFGVLYRKTFQNGTFVTMDDTTHDSYESALREALWLRHDYNDIKLLALFAININSGDLYQLLNSDQIEALYGSIPADDFEYFRLSRDIPVPLQSEA